MLLYLHLQLGFLHLRSSLLANVLVALLLTLIMTVVYFCVEYMGQPEELIPLIKPYFLILLASLVFVMLFNGFKQFTDGITQTQTAMWVLLGGNALNIIGNYILIYGKFGFPELAALDNMPMHSHPLTPTHNSSKSRTSFSSSPMIWAMEMSPPTTKTHISKPATSTRWPPTA